MRRVLIALIALVSAGLLSGTAGAQDVAAKATEAEKLAGQGKFPEALDALDAAVTALWNKAPLTVRRALWVADEPSGFGEYTPRENNIYPPGARMMVYAEPIGFGWRKFGELWESEIVIDMVVRSKDGKELFRKDAFTRTVVRSHVQNREFFARLTYSVSGIPAGEYAIDTIMHDKVTGKSGSFTMPFVVK